jgi:hypothetical protein
MGFSPIAGLVMEFAIVSIVFGILSRFPGWICPERVIVTIQLIADTWNGESSD